MYIYIFQVSWIRHKDKHLLTAGRLVNFDDINDGLDHLKCDDDIKDDDDHHLEFVCYLFQTSSFWAENRVTEWEPAGGNVSYLVGDEEEGEDDDEEDNEDKDSDDHDHEDNNDQEAYILKAEVPGV